jgi:hypothetical protein
MEAHAEGLEGRHHRAQVLNIGSAGLVMVFRALGIHGFSLARRELLSGFLQVWCRKAAFLPSGGSFFLFRFRSVGPLLDKSHADGGILFE